MEEIIEIKRELARINQKIDILIDFTDKDNKMVQTLNNSIKNFNHQVIHNLDDNVMKTQDILDKSTHRFAKIVKVNIKASGILDKKIKSLSSQISSLGDLKKEITFDKGTSKRITWFITKIIGIIFLFLVGYVYAIKFIGDHPTFRKSLEHILGI